MTSNSSNLSNVSDLHPTLEQASGWLSEISLPYLTDLNQAIADRVGATPSAQDLILFLESYSNQDVILSTFDELKQFFLTGIILVHIMKDRISRGIEIPSSTEFSRRCQTECCFRMGCVFETGMIDRAGALTLAQLLTRHGIGQC